MKKRFAVRITAFLLALLMTCSVAPFAAEGDIVRVPVTLDIRVGEIVSLEQLVEESGCDWGYTSNILTLEYSGAIQAVQRNHKWYVYGTEPGKAAATAVLQKGINAQLDITFHVTAAVDPVVKEVSIHTNGGYSFAPLLAEMGYTLDDIKEYAVWDNKNQQVKLLYYTTDGFCTHGNGKGESQCLLNMKDGQVILFNVTITRSATWEDVGSVLFSPFAMLAIPLWWPYILVAPFFILFVWISGFVQLLGPTKYYDVTPKLVF